ncbi:hypothetical protein QTI17_31110 [Variovorax sp. J31P179]|uniref:hypothetical protein n=1 Tax=Variovorax sp. J31P179 TaxID=3053508 RepID=UPI002578F1D1|nr:hypothetical protein [Variovorax sp. J31P179]MDM0085047.1 hypothetical protein [Variovorax sp. J31P179]
MKKTLASRHIRERPAQEGLDEVIPHPREKFAAQGRLVGSKNMSFRSENSHWWAVREVLLVAASCLSNGPSLVGEADRRTSADENIETAEVAGKGRLSGDMSVGGE